VIQQGSATRRRVVLGLGVVDDLSPAVNAAATLAAALGAELLCVLVEREDLVNLAGLPFAKAFGRGGMVSEVSAQTIAMHFNRMRREAEQALVHTCTQIDVAWSLRRPQGEYLREVAVSLEQGDTVVVDVRELQGSGHSPLGVVRQLLEVAAAVVLPSWQAVRSGSVVAVGNGQATMIAESIGHATASKVELLASGELVHVRGRVATIVTPLSEVEGMGAAAFFGMLAISGATAVIVSDSLTEPEPPIR
jgi:hypothetical protein